MSFRGPRSGIFDLRWVFGLLLANAWVFWDAENANRKLRLRASKWVALSSNWCTSADTEFTGRRKLKFPVFCEKVNFCWKSFHRGQNCLPFSPDNETLGQESQRGRRKRPGLGASRRYDVMKCQKLQFHWNLLEGKNDRLGKNRERQKMQHAK